MPLTAKSSRLWTRIALRGLVGLSFLLPILASGCADPSDPMFSSLNTTTLEFAPTDQLRVATYNIQHGRGTDDQVDLERIASVIQDLEIDLIFLQEVDSNWSRSGHVNQVQQLAKLTGLKHTFFAPALRIPIGRAGERSYGNAVLSRYPLVEAVAHALPRRALNEPRNLISVRWMPRPDTTLTLWGTHLSTDTLERRQQLAAIEQLAPPDGMAFLFGDLNSSISQGDVQVLLQGGWIDVWSHLNEEPGATFPSHQPTARIDYILATEKSLATVRHIKAPVTLASDHLPVVMEIDFGEPSEATLAHL